MKRYMIHVYAEGRMHYLHTDSYQTAVMAAQAMYECTAHATISIWNGSDMLWKDNRPVEVGA